MYPQHLSSRTVWCVTFSTIVSRIEQTDRLSLAIVSRAPGNLMINTHSNEALWSLLLRADHFLQVFHPCPPKARWFLRKNPDFSRVGQNSIITRQPRAGQRSRRDRFTVTEEAGAQRLRASAHNPQRVGPIGPKAHPLL